jgi:DNA topoisomerase-6 subunit A
MKKMLQQGIKLEIEALSSKGISFVSEEYVPRKIRDRDYLT